MLILGIIIEIIGAAVVLSWLTRNLKINLRNVILAVSAKDELLKVISGRLAYTLDFDLNLQSSVDMEAALYEITKELSKSTDAQEILNTFKEKIIALFQVDECSVSDTLSQKADDAYSVFKITQEDTLRYLVIKDFGKIERSKIMVLVNQLELFLKRTQLYGQIQKLSITDSLTGMYVRRYFLERLQEEYLRSKQNTLSFSLLLIDLDNFKTVNDTYGHIVGDAVLKEAAKILKSSLRLIDMCGRYGGEEFCILLPETSKETAYIAAERIRLNVQKAKIKAFNEILQASISIGVASYPDDGGEVTTLIDKADKALYSAKAQGRNRVCVGE